MQNLNIVFVKNSTYIKINRRDVVQNHSMIARRIHYKMLMPATPPQEGNGLALYLCRHDTTTPSDRTADYHQMYPPLEPVGKWRNFVRNLNVVFVKNSSYIKINRRDIVQNHSMIAKCMHYKMLMPATPPQEGYGSSYQLQPRCVYR